LLENLDNKITACKHQIRGSNFIGIEGGSMMSKNHIIIALAFLSLSLHAGTDVIKCSENYLGYGLYADGKKIEISYHGEVIKTWHHPSYGWDGHIAGTYQANSPDHISIYYENNYGIIRYVSVHCLIDYKMMNHYFNFTWSECNNIYEDDV
jgi:hypothetical protein